MILARDDCKNSILLAAAMLFWCLSSGFGFAAPSAYQIDAAHDGNIVFKQKFAPPLTLEWSRALGGAVSYPLVRGKIVFVTAANSAGGTNLFALNLKNGATIWEKPIAGTYHFSNATIDRGRLFVVNSDGTLLAFSADAAGKSLWSVSGLGGIDAPPTAYKGQVFVGGFLDRGGALSAVDELTGDINWTAPVMNGGLSSPALGGGGVYVTYFSQYYKFDPVTGGQLWHVDGGEEGGAGATPVFHNGRLYVLDTGTGNKVFDAKSGKSVSKFQSLWIPQFWSDNQGHDLQFTIYDHVLRATDLASGKTAWSFKGDGLFNVNPIVANGIVVVGSQAGVLYLLDAASGKKLWKTNVGHPIIQQAPANPWTGLAAYNGRLIVPASNMLSVYRANRTGASRRCPRRFLSRNGR